jgi:hypothetical protein
MSKVHIPIRNSAGAVSTRHWRWVMATSAAVACGVLWAGTNGAEQVDSGWAIASPSPLATGSKTHDPHQQIILRHVLEQTQQPLLQKPSPTSAAQKTTENSHTGLRFAARDDGEDGWRPVGQPTSIGGDAPPMASAKASGLHPGAPASVPAAKKGAEAEYDRSGDSAASPKAVHANEATSPLADAYTKPPVSLAPAADNEETCQGDVSELPIDDEDTEDRVTESTAPDGTLEQIEIEIETSDAPANEEAASKATSTPSAEKTKPAATGRAPVVEPAEAAPPPPLTKQLTNLRSRVRSVLSGYYKKQLNSHDHDPWEVMHGMLAYEVQSRIRQGSDRGKPITAVGWLCYNKPCKSQTLMYVTPSGEVRAKYGVGLQGHLGQLLAMLAQCKVSADYPIHIGKKEFTINDLIEAEKKTCYPKSELTFKLIALQHYIDLNDTWVNDQGVEWDMPRLVREELAQPIRGAACGGTHRLSGLSLAVKTRIRRGEPLDGEYARAAEFIKKYQQYAFRLQNRDGSLSTSWFRGSGDDDDINRRIKTTGHILEWLCYSLTDEELRDQRTVRAVTYLANLMYSNYDNEWEVGPRSHATHALLLYDQRVFLPFDKEGTVAVYRGGSPEVAKSNQRNSSKR